MRNFKLTLTSLMSVVFVVSFSFRCFGANGFDPNELNTDLQQAFPQQTAPEFLAYFALGSPQNMDLRDQAMKGLQALKLDPAVINQRNNWILEEFSRRTKSLTGVGITKEEAQALIIDARDHAIIGLERTYNYFDPIVKSEVKDSAGIVTAYTYSRNYGFCWGRSEYLYLKLLQKGVHKSAIFRLFDMGSFSGDLNYGKPWPWHMVTIVKALDSENWYALDPVYGEVMTPQEWVSRNYARMTNPNHPPIVYLGDRNRGFPVPITDDPDDVIPLANKYGGKMLEYYQNMWDLFGGVAAVKALQAK